MPWGVAAAVGGAVVSGVASNMAASKQADGQVAAAEAANSPWSAARPYISGEFQPAQDALNTALGMGTSSAYNGERTAALNPYQTQGADSSASFANGNGVNTANQLYGTGMGMTGAGANYGANAQGLLTQAQGDPTQGFINYGNQLANSSTTQSMIDQANLDTSRNLNETQLPSLAVTAAGTGNTDSTRTGVTQAIIQRNASEQMANTAANIRNQMFNTGLNTAQTQYNANQSQALNANQQVGNAFQLGNTALLNGQQANGNNFDQLNAAGGLYQTQQQNVDNAAMQQFNEQQQNPMNLIGQYMNVINGKWGGQAVNPVGPSTAAASIQGALGGAAMGYGAYQKLGGYNNNSTPSGYSMSSLNGSGYSVPASSASDYYASSGGGGNSYGFSMGQ